MEHKRLISKPPLDRFIQAINFTKRVVVVVINFILSRLLAILVAIFDAILSGFAREPQSKDENDAYHKLTDTDYYGDK